MRLIDADALIAPLKEEYRKVKKAFDATSVFQAPNDVAFMQEVGAVIGMIEDAPTVDTPTVSAAVGWICPVCGRGLSPYTTVCPCRNGKGWEVTCD